MPLPVLLFPVELRVFVGSSSVVMPERRIVEAVIEKINADHQHCNITLRGIFWENQGRNAILTPEEAIVNNGLSDPKDCHIGLYIFANWYGSPGVVFRTQYDSATIWEYERSKSRPGVELLVYRKNMTGTTLTITGEDDIKAAEQWIKLVNFFREEFLFPDGGGMRRFYRAYESKDMESGGAECKFAHYVAIDLIDAANRCIVPERSREATATGILKELRQMPSDAGGFRKKRKQELRDKFSNVPEAVFSDAIEMLDKDRYVTCLDGFIILDKNIKQ